MTCFISLKFYRLQKLSFFAKEWINFSYLVLTFDKKYLIFSPCLCDKDSTTSSVLLHNAWPIGSKKTRTKSTILAIHKIASLTSKGYFISPSTKPGVSQKWTKENCFCLLKIRIFKNFLILKNFRFKNYFRVKNFLKVENF